MPESSFENRLREAAVKMGVSPNPPGGAEGHEDACGLVDSSLLEYVGSNPYVPPSLEKEVQHMRECIS